MQWSQALSIWISPWGYTAASILFGMHLNILQVRMFDGVHRHDGVISLLSVLKLMNIVSNNRFKRNKENNTLWTKFLASEEKSQTSIHKQAPH